MLRLCSCLHHIYLFFVAVWRKFTAFSSMFAVFSASIGHIQRKCAPLLCALTKRKTPCSRICFRSKVSSVLSLRYTHSGFSITVRVITDLNCCTRRIFAKEISRGRSSLDWQVYPRGLWQESGQRMSCKLHRRWSSNSKS